MSGLAKLAIPPQLSVAFGLLKRFWWAVPIAGLAIALFFARADAAKWKAADERHVAAFNLEVVKHAVTRQSLEQALASIRDVNTAVDRLKSESDARTAASGKALEAAQRATQGVEASARVLEASAAKGAPAGSCKASAAYLLAKGDL